MSSDAAGTLTLTDLCFGFADKPDFLGPISLSVTSGQCWAIVGPNGAGKSTLLRLMAGLHKPHGGTLRLDATNLSDISDRQRARQIAFVPQQPPSDVDMSARQVVLLGRFPHRSLGLFESAEDYGVAEAALTTCGVTEFADQPIRTLSGGEAQRVHLAAAIAQEPALLLLDEPTASLDLHHQLAVFDVLRARAVTSGLAVVVVTHDVNLAARFCSHVLLLDKGRAVAAGSPTDVLTPEVLAPVYGVDMATASIEGHADRRWIVPINGSNAAP